MAEVSMEEVTKIYGDEVTAVNKMNLDIPDGEFVVFVGPSGCGKSTALFPASTDNPRRAARCSDLPRRLMSIRRTATVLQPG